MAAKKKTSPETEAVVNAVPAAVEKKKTTAKAKSAAATHKTAARKTVARKPAAKAAAAAAQAENSPAQAFDAAAHHEEIAREAYFLYLDRGAHHGHEHEDWLRAIEIVKARYQA